MSKKKNKDGGIYYSTNPDYQPFDEYSEEETLAPQDQKLRIWLEKGGRGGKVASVVKGFVGSEEDLKDLAKLLKGQLGTGGSAKEGEIIIQGDHRDKMLKILTDQKYQAKKAGG
jgi:translation initiation factor 1